MFYWFLLYNNMNQLFSIHMSPPSSSSLPLPTPFHPFEVVTEHQIEFSALYSNFLLAIYFTYGNVYISMLLFQFISSSPSPAVSTSLFPNVGISIPALQVGSSVSLCPHLYPFICQWTFLKKLKIELSYGQQSHYWAYTLRKP